MLPHFKGTAHEGIVNSIAEAEVFFTYYQKYLL